MFDMSSILIKKIEPYLISTAPTATRVGRYSMEGRNPSFYFPKRKIEAVSK